MTKPALPRYDDPPVVEVVMGVQFEPLERFTPVHIGRWKRARDFETIEQHEAVDIPVERPDLGRVTLTLALSGQPPSPAIWLVNKAHDELIQVQQSRFARNWTRGANNEPYPTWRKLLPAFRADWKSFRAFLSAEGLPAPRPTQCEITYVNPIERGVWKEHADFGKVFAPWSGETSEPWPEPETIQTNASWPIDDKGHIVGRLHVSARTAFNTENQEPVILLQLVARGFCGTGDAELMKFFDIGHEWIVRGFTALTTAPMHEAWRRTR